MSRLPNPPWVKDFSPSVINLAKEICHVKKLPFSAMKPEDIALVHYNAKEIHQRFVIDQKQTKSFGLVTMNTCRIND